MKKDRFSQVFPSEVRWKFDRQITAFKELDPTGNRQNGNTKSCRVLHLREIHSAQGLLDAPQFASLIKIKSIFLLHIYFTHTLMW